MAQRVLLEFEDETNAQGFAAHVRREKAVWVEGSATTIKVLPARILVMLEAEPPASRPESIPHENHLRTGYYKLNPEDQLILDFATMIGRLLQVANEGGWNPDSVVHTRVFTCDLRRLQRFIPRELWNEFVRAYLMAGRPEYPQLSNEISWLDPEALDMPGEMTGRDPRYIRIPMRHGAPPTFDPFAQENVETPDNEPIDDSEEEPEDYDPGNGILCAPCLFTEETAKKAITVIAGLAVCEKHLHVPVPHDIALSQHIVRKH